MTVEQWSCPGSIVRTLSLPGSPASRVENGEGHAPMSGAGHGGHRRGCAAGAHAAHQWKPQRRNRRWRQPAWSSGPWRRGGAGGRGRRGGRRPGWWRGLRAQQRGERGRAVGSRRDPKAASGTLILVGMGDDQRRSAMKRRPSCATTARRRWRPSSSHGHLLAAAVNLHASTVVSAGLEWRRTNGGYRRAQADVTLQSKWGHMATKTLTT